MVGSSFSLLSSEILTQIGSSKSRVALIGAITFYFNCSASLKGIFVRQILSLHPSLILSTVTSKSHPSFAKKINSLSAVLEGIYIAIPRSILPSVHCILEPSAITGHLGQTQGI